MPTSLSIMADYIVRDIYIPTRNLSMWKSWSNISAITSMSTLNSEAADHSEYPSCMQVTIMSEDSNYIALTPQATSGHGRPTPQAETA